MDTLVKIMDCKLGEAEELIAERELDSNPEIFEESNEIYRIVKYGYFIRINELNLDIFEGTYENWDEDQKDYMADFSLTIICELSDTHKEPGDNSYLYWEQDGVLVTLGNYLKGQDLEKLAELDCEVWALPEE